MLAFLVGAGLPCLSSSILVGFLSSVPCLIVQDWEHSESIGAAGPVVFLVLLGGPVGAGWLPFLGPASIPREHQDHPEQVQKGLK